jgi:hypothetical protein
MPGAACTPTPRRPADIGSLEKVQNALARTKCPPAAALASSYPYACVSGNGANLNINTSGNSFTNSLTPTPAVKAHGRTYHLPSLAAAPLRLASC